MRRYVSSLVLAVASGSIVGTGLAEEAKTEHPTALHGYCPVAYVAMEQAVKGDPNISLEHAGHRYLFANAKAKEMFETDPSAFEVAYGGWCATAAAMNERVESDPTLFTLEAGVTYLFSSADAKKMFEAEPAKYAYDPAYDGWCATAMSMGKKIAADPTLFTVTDGVAYLFSSEDAKATFDADVKGVRGKADMEWKKRKES